MQRGPRNCAICPNRVDSVFCNLPPAHLHELNLHKTTNRYKRGQVVFYEGNKPTGLFCVGSGKIKLFKTGSEGKEVILRITQAGDVLGYRGILTDHPYSSTAEVIEDAEICFIDRHFFNRLAAEDSNLALELIRRLGEELFKVETRISDMMNRDVRHRFIRLLLTLMKTHGKKEARGMLIDIRLTRSELAAMVGATPETIIRTLSDLEKENYLVLEGKKIIVRDADALLREANLDA
jgi:CRP-like cAMP-binding protein